MTTIKTVIHTYEFDVNTKAGRAAWDEFKAAREGFPHCFGPVFADCYFPFRPMDGDTIELETKHLFENQWNTAPTESHPKGLRVFDWALQSDSAPWAKDSAPRGVRRGHWLEQTDEMRAIRLNTHKCGYCGAQEPAGAFEFCPHCLDSEYLKASDLKLTRMRPISERDKPFPALTEAESAVLLPKYRNAQIHGATERGKARVAAKRARVESEYAARVANAKTEHDGFLWFMDRGINTDNLIFYSHTGKFSFGWRQPVDSELLADVLQVVSEFPYQYEIKCADGRTLSGNEG